MRMMRMVWLMMILVFAAIMNGCATYMHEGDAIDDYVVETSDNDNLLRENGYEDLDSAKSDATSSPTLPSLPHFEISPTIIAEEFLSQFVSIFFGPFSDESVILFNEPQLQGDDGRWIERRAYFTDGHGNVVYTAPFIITLDETWMGWELDVFAYQFRLFTNKDNSEPLIIAMRFESLEFSGGIYVLYEIMKNGNEFLQLGSMIGFHWGGPGPDFIRLAPFINEYGNIIAHMFPFGWSFYEINAEGDFEIVAYAQTSLYDRDTYIAHIWIENEDTAGHFEHFTNDEIIVLLSTGKMQTFFPNFPNGNFIPMIRMYDLEQELTERITERLRGTFPIVERSTQSP